jgi:tetratricopeptide (TPR) repeat protein
MDEALQCFSDAIAKDPNSGGAYANRCVVLVGKGRLPEALADGDAAVRLTPESPEAWNNRGLPKQLPGRRFGRRFDDRNPENDDCESQHPAASSRASRTPDSSKSARYGCSTLRSTTRRTSTPNGFFTNASTPPSKSRTACCSL